MKSIEERANEFIGHPADYDENVTISMARSGFRAGAKSEHEELTKWHSTEEIPENHKWILIKIKAKGAEDDIIFYFPVRYYGGVFSLQEKIGQTLLGWRYIIDENEEKV